ncbi:hypothetical protein FRC10_011293 [Ceratobasidium sp. 414]|nr:hypothetical protein FRC10_011293 [Ceratobasidium sp. 414]
MFSINTNTLSKKDWFTIPPLASLRKPASLDSTPTTGISSKSSSPPPDEAESNGSEGTSSDHGPLDVWTTKLNEGVAQNLTFSWDMPVRGPATRGAFLSEQPARVFVASRYHVQPRLEFDPTTTRRFISPSDLLLSLRATLLGAASLLFGWDEMRAKFFVRSEKTKEDDPGDTVLILGELSEETTMSLIEPLLRIGALLRRLDGTIAKLQSPSATPTARAFAYSLQSTTGLILTDLTTRLPSTLTMTTLTRLSMIFNDIQYELDALAGLCLCPMDESPPFAELPTTQTKLLDHLLLALDDAFKHSAPYRIPAMLSHLLTVSSQDFNNSLAITIGLAPESFHPTRTLVRGDRILLPSFFPPRLRTVLENAARALDVLQRADPGHPLCQKESWTWEGPDWGWTDKDLHNIDTRTRNHIRIIRRALSVWYDSASRASSAAESSIDSLSEPGETLELSLKDDEAATAPTRAYKPELQAAFSVFDQLPGSHLASSAQGALDSRLISDGPTSLPFSAPTLSLVIEATLLALPLAHSRLVSSALLRVFTNRLALKTHLKVVRGFLLGGDQAFWSRLRGALFEGSGISKVSTAVGRGVRAGVRVRLGIVDPVRDQIADERAEREGRLREWGVGLAVGLSERGGPGTWPPGGAELGLRLRHVIDDALEVGWGAKLSTESDDERSEAMERGQDEVVLKETSWRLGFILRDLEDENAEGRARWLNPNGKSIE